MNYYSENTVDRYIREAIFPDFDYRGIMIEVGAGPVNFISNSQHFRETGWRTICYDPNPVFVQQHIEAGSECYPIAISNFTGTSQFTIVDTGHWKPEYEGISYSAINLRYPGEYLTQQEITVKVDTLNNELSRLNIDHIDILCVDVEGWELEVIEGFNIEKYQPRIIVLENYTHDPKYIDFMQNHKTRYIGSCGIDYMFVPNIPPRY